MDITVGDPFFVFTYANHIKESHSIEVIYFATFVNKIDEIKLNPQDHSEYRWFAEDEVDQVIQANRLDDDPEIQAFKKAFSLLKGDKLKYS